MVDVPAAADGTSDIFATADIAANQLDPVQRQMIGARVRQFQNANSLAAFDEQPHEMTADEPGTARDKNRFSICIHASKLPPPPLLRRQHFQARGPPTGQDGLSKLIRQSLLTHLLG